MNKIYRIVLFYGVLSNNSYVYTMEAHITLKPYEIPIGFFPPTIWRTIIAYASKDFYSIRNLAHASKEIRSIIRKENITTVPALALPKAFRYGVCLQLPYIETILDNPISPITSLRSVENESLMLDNRIF